METLQKLYTSEFVELTIVDTSATDYKDSQALRIKTYDDIDGLIDTVQPFNKSTIKALLALDDWDTESAFYDALRKLYQQAPMTSSEPTQPTITSELKESKLKPAN